MKSGIVGNAVTLVLATTVAAAEPVDYPEDYRRWFHVKSMVIEAGHPLFPDFGGIHHVYANEAARRGLVTGRFPDGAVLVFDLLQAVRTGDGAVVEGPRKMLAVMVRDEARFAATDGWGYEAFAGGDPARRLVGTRAAEACHACHRRAAPDFVFSEWRE